MIGTAFLLSAKLKKKGNLLEIELPKTIREALKKNNYYTAIDLEKIRDLKLKYAVILYELILRYKNIQIPELTIQEFKQIFGIENFKIYKYFSKIEKNILLPAIKEIEKKNKYKSKL